MFLLSVHDLSSQVDLCKLLPLDSCEQHLEKRMQQCQSWWLFFDSWPRAAVRTKGSDDAPAGASGISKPLTERGGEPGVSAGLLCVMCIYGIAVQLGTKHAYLKKKKKSNL